MHITAWLIGSEWVVRWNTDHFQQQAMAGHKIKIKARLSFSASIYSSVASNLVTCLTKLVKNGPIFLNSWCGGPYLLSLVWVEVCSPALPAWWDWTSLLWLAACPESFVLVASTARCSPGLQHQMLHQTMQGPVFCTGEEKNIKRCKAPFSVLGKKRTNSHTFPLSNGKWVKSHIFPPFPIEGKKKRSTFLYFSSILYLW